MPWHELRWGLAAPLLLALVACDHGAAGLASPNPSQVSTPLNLQGAVHAGTVALSGASVKVYAQAPSQQVPQTLGQALSDATGAFQLSIVCPSDSENPLQIYVVVSGGQAAGNAQGGSNMAIELVAMLGTCANVPAEVHVNELTTIAAAYALNAFIEDDAISGSGPGLPNAIGTAALLGDPATGALGASLPTTQACAGNAPPFNCEAATKLNALANALAACTASASSTAPACAALMVCSTPNAVDNGDGSCTPGYMYALPTTIWQAILSIARNPGLVSATGLFSLAAAATFTAQRPLQHPLTGHCPSRSPVAD